MFSWLAPYERTAVALRGKKITDGKLTGFDPFEENIQSGVYHFLRCAGRARGQDRGRHGGDQDTRRQERIHFAEGAFPNALIDEGAQEILISMAFLLKFFLAFR